MSRAEKPLTLTPSRRERGLTEVHLELYRPELPSRTQVLKSVKIGSLSPSPPLGERAGVRG
ncbi:hypothetical protein PS732_03491 [Pseudomonas fluorescens]|uniref:Uncharacterized protein n=1 Tax=Pseudomonas fluorescens TaxID=294 RepID=A0ABD7VIR4_PSEFL|nr:hypothetical protein PS732_03491 [Pseudomonas fluorescens]